ncbi:short-chain dehydrogenase [Flagelloscypha sp. PMI_526]|nr:short-chain dehydrogenase [Flagelloscypha sp. PMI_526]
MTSFAKSVSLEGRVALITGGATGIGLMIAKTMKEQGAKVYIVGRRADKLKEAGDQFGLETLQMDVTDKLSIQNAVNHVQEKEGKLDILVNNAGHPGKPLPFMVEPPSSDKDYRGLGKEIFNATDFAEIEKLFSLNYTSGLLVTNAFLELLILGAEKRGKGEYSSVLNISSNAAGLTVTYGGTYAYSASKAGVEHLTKALALTYAQRRIPVRVNAITPGLFPSEISFPDTTILDQFAQNPIPGYVAPAPVLRSGRPEELAVLAVFLTSKAGDYTNGSVMTVDGGSLLVNP